MKLVLAIRTVLMVGLVLTMSAGTAHAEVYQGIRPDMKLAEVKALFPQATVEMFRPSWAQDSDAMCRINGSGLSGTIVVKFDDPRPYYRGLSQGIVKNPTDSIFVNSSFTPASFWEDKANAPDDSALTVAWVRWVPLEPIPLGRLISKYGNVYSNGVTDDDFQPYREWHDRGVTAYLADDESKVRRIDFTFTPREIRDEMERQFPWLKKTPKPQSKLKK